MLEPGSVEIGTASSLPERTNINGHTAGNALGILWQVVDCRRYSPVRKLGPSGVMLDRLPGQQERQAHRTAGDIGGS